MKTVAIIQARMGSSRLPGKVLMNLQGKTVVAHVIERVQEACAVDEVVLATTERRGDDLLAEEGETLGVRVFRGSETDVLGRFHGTALQAGADLIVRITADCPLFDGALLEEMLQRRHTLPTGEEPDYLSNTLRRTYPRGLDAEIFSFKVLDLAHREARENFEREHVTPFIYNRPDRFRLLGHEGRTDLSGYRWTLDTPEDWLFMREVFSLLSGTGQKVSTAAVLNLLRERPELSELNARIEQKKLTE